MAPSPFKRFSNIGLLRRFNFDLLYQFLLPYRDYLCGKHDFRWTDNLLMFPYHDLVKIFATTDEEMPVPLRNGLFFVDELATPKAADALIAKLRDENMVIPGVLTQEDLALYTWMRNPGILESLHAELHMLRIKRFERCFGRCPAWPDLSREALIALEDALNDWFDSLNKGRGVQVMVYERGGTIWFHLRHGELLKSDCDLQNNGVTKRIVYRPERYDCIGYTPHECELLIHAETKREKKAYCQLIGKILLRDENFFHFGENAARYTLDPLKDRGRDALACSDVDGLDRVLLTELHAIFPGRGKYREVYKSENGLFEDWEKYELKIPDKSEFVRASFLLHFAGLRRPRILTVCTPDVTIFERDTESERIMAWLKNRRFAV